MSPGTSGVSSCSAKSSLVAAGAVAEVMVDFALPEAPESVIVREVKSEARMRGVAKFWQGDAHDDSKLL